MRITNSWLNNGQLTVICTVFQIDNQIAYIDLSNIHFYYYEISGFVTNNSFGLEQAIGYCL